MILIADSGATKTDWRYIDENEKIEQFRTVGFNPYYQDGKDFTESIKKAGIQKLSLVKQLYFYGAGCSSDDTRAKTTSVLTSVFPNTKIEANHDLFAAARALCGRNQGIACILGTGSNSALYDGAKLVDNVESLGYVLGDEGSGSQMGKQLLADYLRNKMSKEIFEKFNTTYELDKDTILSKIKSEGGSFLASFGTFINAHIHTPYLQELVLLSFRSFFESNILVYENYQNYKVHFSGSIAFHFNSLLRKTAGEYKITLGNIIESPIAGLTLYHLKNKFS